MVETGSDAEMIKILILVLCLVCPGLHADTDNIDIQGHESGIWSITGTGLVQRWIVIHNLKDGSTSGIYHVEVIQRATGAPAWQIERLANHMAVTEAAVKRSIIKPLDRGAVYPEPFDDAMAEWQAQNNGKGGDVCNTTILACLAD